MKHLIVILIIFLLWINISAQIKQNIIYDLNSEFQLKFGGPRAFMGNFEFEQLPEPLKSNKVYFTLKAITDTIPILNSSNWVIKLNYPRSIELLSDSIFIWHGPHKIGDEFTGVIEFIPYMSGKGDITLYLMLNENRIYPGQLSRGISFSWCFDDDGILRFLDMPSEFKGDCKSTKTFFWQSNKIKIPLYYGLAEHEPLEYEIIISPAPRIGDTSVAHFYIKPDKEIPENYNFYIEGHSLDIIGYYPKIDIQLIKEQELDLAVRFVPKAVKGGHKLGLYYSNHWSIDKFPEYSQTIQCYFLFNNDGSLRYVNTSGFDWLSEEEFPSKFRLQNPYVDNTNIVLKKEQE